MFTPLEYGCVGLAEEDAIKKFGEDDILVIIHFNFNSVINYKFNTLLNFNKLINYQFNKLTNFNFNNTLHKLVKLRLYWIKS